MYSSLGVKKIEEITLNNVVWKHIQTAAGPLEFSLEFAAGAWAQSKSHPGIAHFHEHMVIKESKNFPIETETDIIFSERGIRRNAFTSSDCMSVVFTTPDFDSAKLASEIMLDKLQDPLFLDDRLVIERGAILAELKQRESTPATVVYDQFQNLILSGRTEEYGIIGGEREVIQKISRKDIVEHDRIVKDHGLQQIISAGPVSQTDLKEHIKIFTEIFPFDSKSMNGKRPKGMTSFSHRSQQQIVRLGYGQGESLTFDDLIKLRILHRLLTNGQTSFLYEKLRSELGLIYSVSGSNHRFEDWFLLSIQTDFSHEISKKEVDSIFNMMEIDFFKWVTKEKFERLQKNQAYVAVMNYETNRSKLLQTGTLYGLGVEANFLRELELMQALEYQYLIEFAHKLLKKENRFSLLMNL